MKRSLLSRITPLAIGIGLAPLALHAAPQWIWSSSQALPNEKQVFQRTFNIAGKVKSATLTVTCDNGSTASINGKTAAENGDWKAPARNDVTKLLQSGQNELRIEGRNSDGVAALVAVLSIETADGKKEVIETGPDWQVAVTGTANFKPAVVIAQYGAQPWGDVFKGAGKRSTAVAPEPGDITVPAGFTVELLYTVPKEVQGSWVSMTVDPKGRLIAGDQYGGLYLITPPALGTSEGTKVEPIQSSIGGAHGLLYAFDSLYVMVNEKADAGLWRLRDLNGNSHFGPPELLRKIPGNGEHGPHNIVLGPDGKSLYFAAGNHTKLPESMEKSRAVGFEEDHLLPRMWDANGHAKGILVPGGYTARTDRDGKSVELYSLGFRNHYDIAFDPNGELFTYDSDMEWDMGTPWYMPTRINHSVDGGDYGWRSGAGRWPAYYADSLPGVVDIGPGSPTGVTFGTGAKFPSKYQRAFFGCDWTYGTMFAVHLTPDGATFRGTKEEFVSGKALPLADVVINPKDGAMYFSVGGRRTQSALYRVTYTGNESTAPAPRVEPTSEARLRHELEKLHAEGTGPEAIDKAWPSLGSADRFIRFAARAAIERQPVEKWAERALAEKAPQASIEALIALARMGDKSLQGKVIEALGRFDFAKLPAELRLPLLRAWQLTFTRMGKPAPEVCASVVAKLDPLFPHTDNLVNRELVALLVYLDSPTIVAKTVPLLSTSRDDYQEIATESLLSRNSNYASAVNETSSSRPNRQQIAYAYALRNAKVGWNGDRKKIFFGWFPQTHGWKGGNSFVKFLDNIRTEALANFVSDPAERTALDTFSKKAPPALPTNFVIPKGPGKNYTVDDVVFLAKDGLHGRNFEQGKAMFTSTLCSACHHFNGEGGNVGPDITGSGSRYSIRDLLENIIDPSKVISDQYGSEQIELKDGTLVIGRVVAEENGKLSVMTSPLTPDAQIAVNAADIKTRAVYPVSMMPPGLINTLNPEELLDLLAYVQSAGNPKDKAFAKEPKK